MSDDEETNDVYFEPKDKTDVQIKLTVEGVIEGTEKIFHTHALVLKMASSVFNEMLKESNEIVITDIEEDDFSMFENMLTFIYKGTDIETYSGGNL